VPAVRGDYGREVRIGMVCPYSMTVPGGVQGQVLGLARVLRAMGHETRVLAPCDGPPPELFVIPLGNSIPTAANGSVAPLAPDPACALRTIRALADEAFDVLNVHEPLAPGPSMTALVMHPAPVVGTFHAAGDSSSYRLLNRSVNWLAGRIELRVAVSDDARDLAERYLGGTYDVLFNGVELDRYRVPASVPREGPTIMFCGRHEPRKGLDVLLSALVDLPSDVRCWVASDGPETPLLQERFGADERIEWLGRLTDEEKIARLGSADVFCAPSLRGESFGVVLLEAMAAGTTIVASDLPGYRRVARPDIDALLTPPGDTPALAAALKRVLADDDLAGTLRANGAARAEEFSMRSLAEQYAARFARLAEGAVPAVANGHGHARVPQWLRRIMTSS
jgi:phosphatidyl-myo-inositol alpha-mannosyltransferase